MKPSEFLKKINVVSDLSELDKRFIDREEVKEVIENMPKHIKRKGDFTWKNIKKKLKKKLRLG